MAGIAGWIALARSAADENALGPMLGALEHRGIGELVGYVEQDRKRQAVLGVSLRDPAAHIALVLDGAIANARELRARLLGHGFKFAGESSEEVLLRAYQYWDKDVVKQLRGAFAFVIWDARKDRLLMARDRFGERPLYLHPKDGILRFASEVKALLKVPCVEKRVDLSAVRDCVTYRYVPGPRTLFAGIRKLQPGSYGLWQYGKLHEVRYWTAPDRAPYVKRRNDGALEGFLASLEEAVALHPAEGILLSGGLDSAVLLALASAGQAKPKTFSLGFEGDKASELPHAAQVAKHFGAEHHEMVVAPAELMAHLEYLVSCRDAPVSRPSDLAVCRLASEAGRSAKTLLTGDGCDEVLGGYRRYVGQPASSDAEALPARLLEPLAGESAERTKQDDIDARTSPLRRALYRDQTTWLPDELLERNDRVAAAASVEARLPFLDHRIAEYVSGLPDEQRVRGLTTKWILREAGRRLLPAPLRKRVHADWRLDVAGWLRGELRDFTLDHLQAASSATRHYYDAATLERVLEDHLKGKKNHESLLWTLLNIEIWHRTYSPA
jgi:asparagine synthase (glutamine-hydrolysing)